MTEIEHRILKNQLVILDLMSRGWGGTRRVLNAINETKELLENDSVMVK